MKLVRQTSENDCALACLAMMLNHHGRQISLYELKMKHPIGSAGVSIFDLKTIAGEHDLDTRVFSVSGSDAQLERVPVPFICHWGNQHYAVVTRIAGGRMRMCDPRDGVVEVALEIARKSWNGVAIFMQPSAAFVADPASGRWRRRLPELRQLLPMLGALLALSTVLLGVSFGVPLTISRILGGFMETGELPLGPAALLATGVGLIAGYFLFNWARQLLLLEIRLRLDRRLSERFTTSLFGLPATFFSRMPFGDLIERLSSVGVVREFVSARIAGAIIDIVLVSVLAVAVFVTDRKLGVAYLSMVLLVARVIQLQWPKLRERFRDEVMSYTATFDTFSDALMGIQDIKANRTERVFLDRWRSRFEQYIAAARGRGRLAAGLEALLAMLGGGVPLAVLLLALWLVDRAELAASDAILAYLLIQYSMASLISLLSTGITLQQLVVHTDRIDGLDRFVDQHGGAPDGGSTPVDRIVLEDCSFRYAPLARDVLAGVDLSIGPGGFVVVTGASGSGKSTLLKLLSRTLRPSSGVVRYFNGAQEIAAGEAVHVTSIVQESAMFRGTVLDNITMFDTGFAFDDVVAAAQAASVHEEILALPMGYASTVEHGGANLSGGQRQRIALARALIKRPSLLVLDEFTSHLDAANERRVIAALRRLDCTVVIASHRTTWLQPQDRVLQVTGGTVQVQPAPIHAEEALRA